jgi:RNA polymerase sigma-70 factor (ECF subfamily)
MNRSAEQTPERLLLQARQGEEEALGALLGKYHNYLELLARLEIGRRLQNKVDTADLVQETFLEAHRNFKLFRGSGEQEFVSWLRSILGAKVSNLLRHYIGTQGRDVRREQGLEINLDQSSRMIDRGLMALGSSPSQKVMRSETGVLLAEALAQLPEDYRDVVMLRHLEELSFPEVAERMGKTVDSVQKLWVRALLKLREKMKGFES